MEQPSLLRRLVIPIALAVVIAVCCAVGHHVITNLAKSDQTLRPPARQIYPASENLGTVLATAQRPGTPLFQREISVSYQDVPNFLAHLSVAAAQRGWFMHNPPHKDAILIMPAQDLSELDALTRDPIGWVTRENERITQARGPQTTNLVTVSIDIHRKGESIARLMRFVGIVTLFCMTLLTLWNIGYTINQVNAHNRVAKQNAERRARHRGI